MGRNLAAAADLLLGWSCAGCGTPGQRLCAGCLALFDQPTRPVRAGCPVPIVAAGEYRGPARQVVRSYKLGGMWSLAAALGWSLARAVRSTLPLPSRVTLLPLPSAGATVRRRGLDTTAALAAQMARQLTVGDVAAAVRPVFVQRRGMRDQVGLSGAERRVNLAEGVAVRPRSGLTGVPVLLVDDIVTTGATASAAVHAAQSAGALVIGVAVLAHAPLGGEPSR